MTQAAHPHQIRHRSIQPRSDTLPGIFALVIGSGASQTSVAIAEDLTTGMIGWFRSLPIPTGALLAGQSPPTRGLGWCPRP
jgi:hypothetical protein